MGKGQIGFVLTEYVRYGSMSPYLHKDTQSQIPLISAFCPVK